jgi:hypothetical protein
MKRTLLDMTQDILSSLDSDEVNSIGDTTESLQVANIIKNTWWNIVSRAELPEHFDMFGLDASTDIVLPVLMLKPSNVDNIKWIKYYDESTQSTDGTSFVHDLNTDITSATPNTSNPDLNYKTVDILPITDFLTYVNRYNPYEDNIESYTLNGITLRYRNDRQPSYCGVLSDKYVLFDSYDSTVEDTLQQSKVQAYGQIIPEFKLEDNFIPLLDDYQFPLLFNEAKSLAFFELKQMAHQKAEQEAKRQWSSLQKDKAVVDKPTYFNQFPNFGRK